jgi:hypothetical protein
MADPRRGVYNPVLPLDVLILKELPKEGSTFMGVYPEGASISDLLKVLAGGKLSSPLISTRLRVLHLFGMAESVKVPRSPTSCWQITPKGEQFVRENPLKEVPSGDPGTAS